MRDKVLNGFITGLFCLFIYQNLAATFGWSGTSVHVRTLTMTAFCLLHAVRALGPRNAWFFFVVSGAVSWTYEQVGVITGAIYGNYVYSDMLGAKLGHVPLLIPIAWFMMIYPSHVIANALAAKTPYGFSGGLGRLLWMSFIAAMVMTGWDVIMDPEMAEAGYWTWLDGGPYHGVPFQNYLGWMLTTFTVYTVYRLWERKGGAYDSPGNHERFFGMTPILVYLTLALRYTDGAEPVPLRLVAVFVMVFPCLIALTRVVDGFAERNRDLHG